jgi:hypothetical protein
LPICVIEVNKKLAYLDNCNFTSTTRFSTPFCSFEISHSSYVYAEARGYSLVVSCLRPLN